MIERIDARPVKMGALSSKVRENPKTDPPRGPVSGVKLAPRAIDGDPHAERAMANK